jgi:lipoic acid synthetase
MAKNRGKRPSWLKVRLPQGENYRDVRSIIDSNRLHTVCESARCPNVGECWNRRTATFMILGNICTRSCGFCAVKTGRPTELDLEEPFRVAEAVARLRLRHAVITSVNRDELEDGGASIFAETIRQIRKRVPGCRVEVLTPDFKGDEKALDLVVEARPDIFNHNLETVPRLYPTVRPQAKYDRSLYVLDYVKRKGLVTKSGLMVGIGEQPEEIIEVLKDLRRIAVDIVTIGQYLQPTPQHLPVDRYVTPDEFAWYRKVGLEMGFSHVESGPLVRSSYHADEQAVQAEAESGTDG